MDAKRCNWFPIVRFASSFISGVQALGKKADCLEGSVIGTFQT